MWSPINGNTPPRMTGNGDENRMVVVNQLAHENMRLRQEVESLRAAFGPGGVGQGGVMGPHGSVSELRRIGFGALHNPGAPMGLAASWGVASVTGDHAVLRSILGQGMGNALPQPEPCGVQRVSGVGQLQQAVQLGSQSHQGGDGGTNAGGSGTPSGGPGLDHAGSGVYGSDPSGVPVLPSSQNMTASPGGGGGTGPTQGASVPVGGSSVGQERPGGPGGFGGGGPGEVPLWVATLLSQQESIRTAELPGLADLGESEIGPLVAGDWLTSITPLMKDLSPSSAAWWETVLSVAGSAYQGWLGSDPLTRLQVQPVTPQEFSRPPFARVEQRAQTMLLKALPDSLRGEIISNRSMGSVQIIFRVLTRYQPGGLAERTTLLKQLVEIKAPSNVAGVASSLRSWKRWLVRVSELGINPPDATLLMSALDRLASVLTKGSPQTGFRLSSARAQLQVDTCPSLHSVMSFAETMMAEAESLFHGGAQLPIDNGVKIKAMNSELDSPPQATGKSVVKEEPGSSGKPCKFFVSDGGCKKGKQCGFQHVWGTVNKYGRCWNCGSNQHRREACPVAEIQQKESSSKESATSKPAIRKQKNQPAAKKVDGGASQSKEEDAPAQDGKPKAEAVPSSPQQAVIPESSSQDHVAGLLAEATHLLRLMRPSIKAVKLSSLPADRCGRALLDGGATHALRTAASKAEFESAIPVRVELAAGEVVLRQLPGSGVLLSETPTQTIVPLGKVMLLGYSASWDSQGFMLKSPTGEVIETHLEGDCPTVDEAVALELISELEEYMIESERRLKALRGEEVIGIDCDLLRWLQGLQKLFPEVPDEILVQIPPRKKWTGETVPWNRKWRKRISSAPALVLHLFSGGNPRFWQEGLAQHGLTALCVDKCIHPDHDLLRDQTFHYLIEVCEGGRVESFLGGPPCRTVSKLRFRSPGPPPVRARSGLERFGLRDLSPGLRECVLQDTLLWLRFMWLYTLAQDSRDSKVGFLSESPEDPENYKKEDDLNEYPSFYSWPEWKSIRERYGLFEVNCDQGPFVHEVRKPTTLGTNLGLLRELQNVRGPGCGSHKEITTIDQRIERSRRWAAWAPKLKDRILEAIVAEFKIPLVRKLSEAQWKQHRANDHQPFSPECMECQVGGGRQRPHLRIHNPDTYTLSVDVCGAFCEGHDQLVSKAKYALVGVFTIPISADGEKLCSTKWDFLKEIQKEADEPPENAPSVRSQESEEGVFFPEVEDLSPLDLGEGALPLEAGPGFLPEPGPGIVPEAGPGLLPEPGLGLEPGVEEGGDMEKWEAQIDTSREVFVKNFTMVEILPSRTSSSILSALNRMMAKLNYLGFNVRRLHSDRGAELSGRAVSRWAEEKQILRTFTSGPDWKSNGRVESEIG